MNPKLKVLIVDDSILYRRFIRAALSDIDSVEVVGHASNGVNALAQIDALHPDLVVLDIHMPGKSGIDVLRNMKAIEGPEFIVLTSNSESSVENTTLALKLGAFDFVLKPNESTPEENHRVLVHSLGARIKALRASASETKTPKPEPVEAPKPTLRPRASTKNTKNGSIDVIVIGVSTGGPAALMEVIPRLPAGFHLPILIVQHMPALFTKSLARDLNNASALTVLEGEDGAEIKPGNVYIAPGGMQMKVQSGFPGPTLRVVNAPSENHCKPSVDYLLRSVADVYGARTFTVIMTGMGSDGTLGCKLVARKGGSIITQDEESCVVYGMPRSVVEAGLSQESCKLLQIPERIVEASNGSIVRCQR